MFELNFSIQNYKNAYFQMYNFLLNDDNSYKDNVPEYLKSHEIEKNLITISKNTPGKQLRDILSISLIIILHVDIYDYRHNFDKKNMIGYTLSKTSYKIGFSNYRSIIPNILNKNIENEIKI